MSDRIYYRLKNEGITQKVLQQFVDDHIEIENSWKVFAHKYGAKKYYASSSLLGLLLDKPDLELWHSPRSLPRNCYKPKRVKDSALLKEFNALKSTECGHDLAKKIGVECPLVDGTIYFPTIETVGSERLLNLHKSVSPPSDATALKMSEYYQLREAAVEDAV